MDFDGVDMDAALDMVVKDMGRAATDFKKRRYAPKPKPKAEEPVTEETQPEESQASLSELESMLTGG